MYAMDTAVHFEHRTEPRRDRAARRRDRGTAVAPTVATPDARPTPSSAPLPAAHDFAD
jgi:hypothetical protein